MPIGAKSVDPSLLRLPQWRSERVMEDEILDEIPGRDARVNVRDMARINRLFGGFRLLRRGILRLADGANPLTILDIAAAAGNCAEWLHRALPGCRVTSADLRPDLLALSAGEKVAANALHLPFRDGAFDVVSSTLFLHHLTAETLVVATAEMLRVSRKGVVAVDLLRHPLAYRFLGWSHPFFGWNWITRVDGARSVQAAFSQAELAALLRGAGYPQAQVRTHHPWFRLSMSIPKTL